MQINLKCIPIKLKENEGEFFPGDFNKSDTRYDDFEALIASTVLVKSNTHLNKNLILGPLEHGVKLWR